MVLWADGIRSARVGRTVNRWRRAIDANAGSDEPEDQVSGKFPAIRAIGASRKIIRLVRVGDGEPLHAAGRAGHATSAARSDGGRATSFRAGKAAGGPFQNSGRDACRLFGTDSNC